ncbi:MAG: hypothetical protein C9356_20285 [Oleiphilus sp.]|nr:MAG: hypothetical protein C9356_20285 [Oleiphilus sp.]
MFLNDFGFQLSRERKRLNLTLREVARQCDVSGAFYFLCERGDKKLDTGHLFELKEMGMRLDYLFSEPEAAYMSWSDAAAALCIEESELQKLLERRELNLAADGFFWESDILRLANIMSAT